MTSPAGHTDEFKRDSMKWRGVVLTGEFAHWCYDWDGLPVDETCDEFTCCSDVNEPAAEIAREKLRAERSQEE